MLKCLHSNLSTSTTQLLKAVLPARHLWMSLRDTEGLFFDATIRVLKSLHSVNDSGDDDNGAEPWLHMPSDTVPEGILSRMKVRTSFSLSLSIIIII